MLERLPEDILVNILSWLEPLEGALSNLPCVCRAWSRDLFHHNVWMMLAKSRNLSPITSRRHANKRAFIQRYLQARRTEKMEIEKVLLRLGKRLEKSDCVHHVRKQLIVLGSSSIVVHTKVSCWEHRTLLHVACWRGRVKTVKMLLEEYYCSQPFELDDSGASPLLLAAWSGHTTVVRELLKYFTSTAYLDQRGVPPLTSSCGGKGPKTALCWAKRKGFQTVVRLLKKAGATG